MSMMQPIARIKRYLSPNDWRLVGDGEADLPPIAKGARVRYLGAIHTLTGEWAVVRPLRDDVIYQVRPNDVEIVNPWGDE